MGTMTSINFSIPILMRKYIERKVEAGEYGSTSEVIREALRDLMRREKQAQFRTRVVERPAPIDVSEYVWTSPDQLGESKPKIRQAKGALAHRRQNRKDLEKLLIEGLESGPAVPWTPLDSAKLKQQLIARHGKHQRKAG